MGACEGPPSSTGEFPPIPDDRDVELRDLPPLVVPQVEVDLAAMSHPGNVRPNNEDHYLAVRLTRGVDVLGSNVPQGLIPARIDEHGYLYVVADGLGGMAAGEYASMLAVRAGLSVILGSSQWCFRIDERSAPELMERCREYFRRVDEVVVRHSQADQKFSGMATTLTSVYTVGVDAFITHVGDSRAYVFRDGTLRRLTNDHTMAEYLAEVGAIRPEDVATHARRNVLINFAGGPAGGINPQVAPYRLRDGDQLLLCSDGLTEMVEEPRIAEALAAGRPADEVCRELIDLALLGGGRDNITAIVARYRIPFTPGPPWFDSRSSTASTGEIPPAPSPLRPDESTNDP